MDSTAKNVVFSGLFVFWPRERLPGYYDDAWFVNAIRYKVLRHPDGVLEYPFLGERIFHEPLMGFVRGDDPLLARYKEIIGPHLLSAIDIMV